VLQWFFYIRTLQLGGGKITPGVYRVLCQLEAKY